MSNNQTAFALQVSEGFGTAFKVRSILNQDPKTFGQVSSNAEDLYLNTAQLGPSTGYATQATRITAVFSNIPSGVNLYAAVQARSTSVIQHSYQITPAATLVSADANGNGGTPVTGLTLFGGQYQPLSITTPSGGLPGFATSTWEMTATDPNNNDNLALDIVADGAQYTVDTTNHRVGPIQTQPFLSPVSTDLTASLTAPVPRFVNAADFTHPTHLMLTTIASNGQSQAVANGSTIAATGNFTFLHTIAASVGETGPITLVQTIPSALVPLTCNSPGGSCTFSNNQMTATVPSLLPGQSAVVTFSAAVSQYNAGLGSYSVATTLSSPNFEVSPVSDSTNFTFNVNNPSTVPITFVASSTPNMLVIDGASYSNITAPLTFQWAAGSTHTATASDVMMSSTSRNHFTGWTPPLGAASQIIVPTVATSYVASYTLQNQLLTAVTPSNGGAIAVAPTSPDGFYASGAQVQITAIPNFGWQFSGFSGDLTTLAASSTLSLSNALALQPPSFLPLAAQPASIA